MYYSIFLAAIKASDTRKDSVHTRNNCHLQTDAGGEYELFAVFGGKLCRIEVSLVIYFSVKSNAIYKQRNFNLHIFRYKDYLKSGWRTKTKYELC